MNVEGKVCVVTGAARGIGRALCVALEQRGATVVGVDVDRCDVSREEELEKLVRETIAAHGRIDLFVSNAGIVEGGGPEATNEQWRRSWDVNLMAHVWAARHCLPSMLARREGYLLSVASAAGLLTSIGSAPYAVTKHAAVAFAEWLSITYAEQGIRVSCLCPQGVNTPMLRQGDTAGLDTNTVRLAGDVLEPAEVADIVHDAIRREEFLILPHPEVHAYVQVKAGTIDRWLGGMRKLQRRAAGNA